MLDERLIRIVVASVVLLFAPASISAPSPRGAVGPPHREAPHALAAAEAAAMQAEHGGSLYPLAGDAVRTEVKKVTDSDAGANEDFGWSVAVWGDTVVVGARNNSEAGTLAGTAYAFERNQGGAGNWGLVEQLIAGDTVAYDRFGAAVAIAGDTVVVGAPGDSDGGTGSGSAYVFERNLGGAENWGEAAKLTAADAATGDEFGSSVAISGDTVVVAARENEDAGQLTGSAYVFERDQGGANNWGQVKKLLASDMAADDLFGASVAVSGDTVLVGADGNDDAGSRSGSAYVFERDQGGAGNWGEVLKLTAGDAAVLDRFGHAVAIAGDTVVVGAWGDDDSTRANFGSAYVYERNQGGANNWGEVKKLSASDGADGDNFSYHSVAISGDMVVVGAYLDDDAGMSSGSAYLFERDHGGAGNWGEVEKLRASDAEAGDNFGVSSAISGNAVVVGAFRDDETAVNSGSAYVFDLATPLEATLISPTGAVSATTPTYTWSPASRATSYYLWVNGPSGNVIKQWFTAAAACSGVTCSVTPSTALAGGHHVWWVQTWNAASYGPWSEPLSFAVGGDPAAPGAAVLVAPSGTGGCTTPTYRWNEVSSDPPADVWSSDAATWYYLWVEGPSGIVLKQWYTAATAGCPGGACSATQATALGLGGYSWWIRTWNAAGYGPWSTRMDFTVANVPPPAAALVSPAGTITDPDPTYAWNAVCGATWYYLWVDGPAGNVITQWYTATAAGCPGGAGTCSVTPPTTLNPGGHSWWIRAWSPAGSGPWSSVTGFTVQ